MKKGYIWKRLFRSLISILVIMLIVFTMVYTLVPRENIFFEDPTYSKLGGKSDEKTEYTYNTWEKDISRIAVGKVLILADVLGVKLSEIKISDEDDTDSE